MGLVWTLVTDIQSPLSRGMPGRHRSAENGSRISVGAVGDIRVSYLARVTVAPGITIQ